MKIIFNAKKGTKLKSCTKVKFTVKRIFDTHHLKPVR